MDQSQRKHYKWSFWCWLQGKHSWEYTTPHKRECNRCHTHEIEVYNRIKNKMYNWMDITLREPISKKTPSYVGKSHRHVNID